MIALTLGMQGFWKGNGLSNKNEASGTWLNLREREVIGEYLVSRDMEPTQIFKSIGLHPASTVSRKTVWR